MSDLAWVSLWLDAPLMSWGFASRFQRRTTALHPTRSAITGMICAALGSEKGSDGERELLERLDKVEMAMFTLRRQPEGEREPLKIRRLEDFHTVTGTRSAENKPKKDAVITHRQYLMDARFGVLLTGEAAVLVEVAAGLRNPQWGIWFGRKNCIPASPVLAGDVAQSREEAIAHLERAAKRSVAGSACVEDAVSFAEGTDTLMDVPVNFKTREFKPRRIRLTPETLGG